MSIFNKVTKLAESGDSTSQLLLGFLCDHGFLTRRNPASAREWYEAAAKQGVTLAEYLLYHHLLPMEKDRQTAMTWLRSAAEAGNVAAALELGAYYRQNLDEKGADELAFKWTKLAADNGYLPALHRLAVFYKEGRHVKKDMDKCRAILRKGAKNNDPDCAYDLGSMLLEESASEGQTREGLKWLHHAAAHGSWLAYRALSLKYAFGEHGLARNPQLVEIFNQLSLETHHEN